MDQKSELWLTAKQILNNENEEPLTDTEINEVIKFLNVLSDLVIYNIIQN